MEKIKQKIVLPTKGVCNTTPDPICEDNEMEDCIGLTYSDDAIRPIQDVKQTLGGIDGTLMYVHRLNDGNTVNHIVVADNKQSFSVLGKAYIYNSYGEINSVTAIGNTIIVSTDAGLRYFVWKVTREAEQYHYLGNRIPEPNVGLHLSRADGYEKQVLSFHNYEGAKLIHNFTCTKEIWNTDNNDFEGTGGSGDEQRKRENQEAYQDIVMAMYAENKKVAAENGRFVNPFLAVYAVELSDGSYTLISNPILMYPSLHNHTIELRWGQDLYMLTMNSAMFVSQSTNYNDWSDIVRGVSLFLSNDIDLYDTEKIGEGGTLNLDGICGNSMSFVNTYTKATFYCPDNILENIILDNTSYAKQKDLKLLVENEKHYALKKKSTEQILNAITETSTFFKIADLGFNVLSWKKLDSIMKPKALLNLATQGQLKNIDYYSRSSIIAKDVSSFNRRLNVIGIDRTFFEGFKSFCAYEKSGNTSGSDYPQRFKIVVTIQTGVGEREVTHIFRSRELFHRNMWFYYPDPRAKKVSIYYYSDSQWLPLDGFANANLTEHRGLNGAYYIGNDIPTGNEEKHGSIWNESDSTIELPENEHLPNYLLQSEVDNPFAFNASSYFRVGQGNIIGISALTTALSQDAYKVATTIVFTTQGIWALEIDSTGVYKTVPPPFSREVCSNPKSITMVDHGVYFVSKKGLMQISDNGNGCVSTQLCGKNHEAYDSFVDFAQGCTMAYDYRDSQLWLTNEEYDYHWVFNMKTGTLSRKIDGRKYKAIVPDYPDTLLQSGSDAFTMYWEDSINEDGTTYTGSFVTRPMKFEQAMALKSIRDLKHIMDINDDASIVLTILASNDCKNWQVLESIKGRGFKYYKFKYEFTNLKAYDAFCGTILYYTTRETDRLR